MLKHQVKKMPPLVGGGAMWALLVRGFTGLLNTEGVLTLPMFLLIEGSLIQM